MSQPIEGFDSKSAPARLPMTAFERLRPVAGAGLAERAGGSRGHARACARAWGGGALPQRRGGQGLGSRAIVHLNPACTAGFRGLPVKIRPRGAEGPRPAPRQPGTMPATLRGRPRSKTLPTLPPATALVGEERRVSARRGLRQQERAGASDDGCAVGEPAHRAANASADDCAVGLPTRRACRRVCGRWRRRRAGASVARNGAGFPLDDHLGDAHANAGPMRRDGRAGVSTGLPSTATTSAYFCR